MKTHNPTSNSNSIKWFRAHEQVDIDNAITSISNQRKIEIVDHKLLFFSRFSFSVARSHTINDNVTTRYPPIIPYITNFILPGNCTNNNNRYLAKIKSIQFPARKIIITIILVVNLLPRVLCVVWSRLSWVHFDFNLRAHEISFSENDCDFNGIEHLLFEFAMNLFLMGKFAIRI